ncbi:hypothetical protein [uncultured Nostoc sp.]|uniref:hypothetical protein n=1 Tax=uncultured Nostoc sp. TaxID=340711 RepID=UPI0035CA3C74
MKFHRLTTRVMLAMTTILSLRSVTYASTKYNVITKQTGQQIAQLQPTQPKPQAENISINQAGETLRQPSRGTL